MGEEQELPAQSDSQAVQQQFSAKSVLTALAKFAFAALILYWLYRKGAIQTDKLAAALAHWPTFLFVCAITMACNYFQGFRWLALMRARGIELSRWNAFQYLMEGKFFNLIVPGQFSEDFMRGLYAIRTHKESRSKVIGSLLVDRAAGVFTMLMFGAIGLLARPALLGNPGLRGLLLICGIPIGGTFAGVIFLRVIPRPPQFVLSLAERLHLHIAIDRMYAEGRFYATNFPLMLIAVGYTLVNQAAMVWCFYLLGTTLGMSNVGVLDFVVFAPCGMLATILPVAPVGLGVGQGAFLVLFRMAGSEQGANLFSLYTLMAILLNLCGAIFYLRNKGKS